MTIPAPADLLAGRRQPARPPAQPATAAAAMTSSSPQASTLPRRRPGTHHAAAPRISGPSGYDLDCAWQLLAATCELPATERGLLKILTEYRRALYALATELQAIRHDHQPSQPPPQPTAQDGQSETRP